MKIRIRISLILIMLFVIAAPFNTCLARPHNSNSTNPEDLKIQPSSRNSTTQVNPTSSEGPPTEWNQTYGGSYFDRGHSIVETIDGGYAIAGETDSYGAGYQDFWLIRTDSSGNEQWNQTYGGSDADRALTIARTIDNGYALAGHTGSFGAGNYDFWLIKTDSSGNMEWNQTYGGTSNDIATSVVQTNDGGYALTGDTYSYGAGGYDIWLTKTDVDGNMELNKTYGGTDNDFARSLVQTSDGGYAISGYTASYGTGGKDFWLIKTDSSGSMQWNQTYGGTNNDIATSLVQTNDGGYAISGYTASYGAGLYDFWLVKTDPTGNILWNQTYGGTNNDISYSVVQTNDGGYALAGDSASYGAGLYDFWLLKTDSSGNTQWNQTYGGTNNDIAHSLVQTSDEGYAIVGYTASYGAGGDDIWLIKIDTAVEPELHDVAVIDVAPSRTVVGQGYDIKIYVTVTNQGNCSESFNAMTYANSTVIDTLTDVTLSNESSATLIFTWNTTGFAKGNYTIRAHVIPVPGETDTSDNTYTDGLVMVTIPGDVNGDSIVDISDLSIVAMAYGRFKGEPFYNPAADLNEDEVVDIGDISIVCMHYGEGIV